VVEASPSRERRTAWRRLLVGLGVLGFAGACLVALARSAPAEPRRPFDQRLVRRIARHKPDIVVLGNSMVETRFDEAELNRLLSPTRVTVLGVGGSKSAYWYLTLKNVVLPAVKPKRVLLVFRRRELTGARDKATGAFANFMSRVRHAEEPLVDAKLAPPKTEPIEWLGYELERLAPFPRLHALADPLVEGWARELTGARGKERRRMQRALDEVFATDKLRNANLEPATLPREHGDFADVVESSLLPDIIELLDHAKVPLTVVRIRTKTYADGRGRASAYDQELDAYLRERHVELLDLSHQEWEKSEMYGEGDHIAPRFRNLYTRLFVKNLRKAFR